MALAANAEKIVGVKYCGGCNSVIDRVGLVEGIKKVLPGGYVITTDPSGAPWDIGVIVCGCATACADRTPIKPLAKRWIVVAGTTVDLHKVPEEKLAAFIADKIVRPPDGW